MRPQAILNYLLGATEGLVMYSIYSDYANKIQSDDGTWKVFDTIKDGGWVPKAYKTIVDFTGIRPDTVKSSIERLVKKGLLQKKPGNKETNNIPLYKPEFKSSVFIKIAEGILKTPTGNKLNQKNAERFIPEIISTFEKDSHVLVALELVNRTRLEEFLDKSNPAKKVTDTEEIQETNPQKTPLPEYKNNRDPFKHLNLVRRAN